MVQATEAALADAHLGRAALDQVDTLVVVRSFRESTPNSPEALAKRLGASSAAQWLMPNGGNGPQYLVNRYAQAIAEGRCELALFSGAEAMDNGRKLLKAGITPPWEEPTDRKPSVVDEKKMSNDIEDAHGLMIPATAYPLYEKAPAVITGTASPSISKAWRAVFPFLRGGCAPSPCLVPRGALRRGNRHGYPE